MICNIGPRDRVIRMVSGIALVIAYEYVSVGMSLLGCFLLMTGFIRWCPFYVPFKVHSK